MNEPAATIASSGFAVFGGLLMTIFGVNVQTLAAALVAAMLSAWLSPKPGPTALERLAHVGVVLASALVSAIAAIGVASYFKLSAEVEHLLAAGIALAGPIAWKKWMDQTVDKVTR